MSTSELACTYAALILHDDGIAITAEKIATLVKTAGLTVESYWPSLFAKLAANRNIADLILSAGSAATPASGFAPVPMASSADGAVAAAAPPAEEKKEEAHEESEDDMVFGLFD